MGAVNWVVLLLTHPLEFRTLLQFYLYHEQKRDIKAIQEHPTSGWDRDSMKRCWHFLDLTSRSFAAVIKELEGDLARTIALFYLVLRGLDTIEDDMTIPDDVKQPILRKFHELTVTPGWKYDGCGPDEKDRQLLVEYDTVVSEVNLLDPKYKEVIIDITKKMASGMADYAHVAATSASSSSPNGSIYLSTISEYDLYCHYVAGLVGEGLSRIFAVSGKEEEWIGDQLELSNSMGLLLQKTNIIRDFREDVEQGRHFWPKEIWGKYGFKAMKEMCATDEDTATRAKWVQSHMILDALRHVTDSLDYLKLLKNQSVFNFCAIPATMAIATLDLCFSNPAMFQRNIKIRKATAARLIMRSTNPREVAAIFREYARSIHGKLDVRDPSYLKLGVVCGRIEMWMEHHYPSFVCIVDPGQAGGQPRPEFTPEDPRSRIFRDAQKRNLEVIKRNGLTGNHTHGVGGFNPSGLPMGFPALADEPESASNEKASSGNELIAVVGGAMVVVCGVALGIVWLILRYAAQKEAGVVEGLASAVPKVEL